jgi:hypothetical protein
MLSTSGCTVYSTLKSNYTPTVDPDLADLAPVTVRLQVTDNRPSGERDNIGRMNKRVYLLDKEPTKALFDAIKAGLEVNGHRVEQQGETAAADVVLDVKLNRFYWAVGEEGIATIITTSTVQADVHARNINGEPKESSFAINGAGQMKFFWVGAGGEEKITNQALSRAVDQLLSDYRFLEVINRPEKSSDSIQGS